MFSQWHIDIMRKAVSILANPPEVGLSGMSGDMTIGSWVSIYEDGKECVVCAPDNHVIGRYLSFRQAAYHAALAWAQHLIRQAVDIA